MCQFIDQFKSFLWFRYFTNTAGEASFKKGGWLVL